MAEQFNKHIEEKRGSKDHIPETALIITCGVIVIVSLLLLTFA